MVIENVNGNPDATSNGPGYFGSNDVFQLCISNHPGYSSDVVFQVNFGGGLGDLGLMKETLR